jgi:hypothetical protein
MLVLNLLTGLQSMFDIVDNIKILIVQHETMSIMEEMLVVDFYLNQSALILIKTSYRC